MVTEPGIVNLYALLTDGGLITKPRLDAAYAISLERQQPLFDVLLEEKILAEDELLPFLSEKLQLPYEVIDRATIDFRISTIVPEQFAREHFVLPLFQIGNALSVAVTNPFEVAVLEELEMITGMDISPVLTPKSSIENLFQFCYSYQERGSDDEGTSMASLFEMGMKLVEDRAISEAQMTDLAQEAPIAKLVDTIIKQAIVERASDIHIEPEASVVKIRFRVDGLLKDVMAPPKKLESAILSRLKILSSMDITETRKPQDGRMTFPYKDKDIDFRVSTVRTIIGEKMVLRILDKSGAFVSLEKLGLNEVDYKRFMALIHSTSGILIVCGPTGSGKTSTLYSGLSKINTPEKNIITIEDPVEFNIEGVNQIPVNAKIGVTFVSGLSTLVRQDPDVIMVGEIRDVETASVSIQAALTGHLVFTTLHTRDAPGALTRLVDMGIQPFLLTSSIIGIVAQRLVRTLCPNCKRSVDADQVTGFKQVAIVELIRKQSVEKKLKVYMGQGCKFCGETGYKGRIGIFEIMMISEEVRDLCIAKASTEQIAAAAVRAGMTPMMDDGIQKVLAGWTTVDELARVLDA